MDIREYERLHLVEHRMWWFRALHKNLIAAAEVLPMGARVLLDAGCGTGGLLARLKFERWDDRLIGLDFEPMACRIAREKSGAAVIVGSIDRAPLASRSVDLAFSADVLCHAGVDAAAALAELRRCLKPGGRLVLNLPAYQWMLSAHDRAVANVRRFTRTEVETMLAAAGFVRTRATYWNSLLFPLMLLQRLVLRRDGGSDVEDFPAALDRLFGAVLTVERALHRIRFRLPFGGSILAIAENP